MKKLFYIFFLLLVSFQVLAQTFAPKKFYLIDSLNLSSLTNTDRQLIDSCLTLYHQAKDDTTKINALNTICENMMHDDWSKYLFLQHKIIEQTIAQNPPKATLLFLKIKLAGVLDNMGVVSNSQGDMALALKYHHKSLKLDEEIGNKYGIAQSLNNIGIIYQIQDDISSALSYYQKSLQLREEIGDKQGIAYTLINIGYIYRNQNKMDLALEYFHKSLQLQEEIVDKQGLASSLNNIGSIYDSQGNTDLALLYFNKSLQVQEEIGDKLGLSYSLVNIGEILLNKGVINGTKGALFYALQSLKIGQELGFSESIKYSANLLSKIYEKQNKGIQALEMYKLHIQMRDSINNESTQKASAQQLAKYEYEKQKAIDDAEHEKQLAIEQEAQAKQKVVTYAIAVGLVLVIFFLLFIFNRLQVTRKQKTIIETQKLEVEQQKAVVEKAHLLLEEKNNEILASIRYAKRIQDALMTSQKYIERNINRLKKSN